MNSVNADHVVGGIMRKLIGVCHQVSAEFKRLAVNIRPELTLDRFRSLGSDKEVAHFQMHPVVLNVPEHPGMINGNMFVVVEGLLSFQRQAYLDDGLLRTSSFATHVGYFRRERNALVHVFGAHYDFELCKIGHPVFHAQFKSFARFAAIVRDQFSMDASVPDKDHMVGIAETVRLPTAQIDVFSSFIQVCADHLMHQYSGTQEREAFNRLLEGLPVCHGAAYQIPRLGSDLAKVCYRSRHWYPIIN